MKLKIVFLSVICFAALLSVSAQQRNPFDIKSRLIVDSLATPDQTVGVKDNKVIVSDEATEDKSTAPTTQKITKDLNPFDIQRTNSVVPEPVEQVSQKAIENEIKPETKVQKEGSVSEGNFLFWIILFSFLILAVSLSLDRWYITKIFKGIFNYNLSNTMMRETTGFKIILTAILYILFIISFALFIFLSSRHFNGRGDLTYFLYILGAVLGVYLIRHLALFLMNLIFPRIPELGHFSYSIASFNMVTGILLLIPVLLLAFSSQLVAYIALICGLIIIAAMYLLRSFRGLLISFNYIINIPIHFFLYLCAFEIVPLLLVYKIVTDFV